MRKGPRVTSDELAQEVADFIGGACARVMGSGQIQYEKDGQQKFESMSLEELVDWTIEELQDVAVYSVMLAIRIQRVQELINGRVAKLGGEIHAQEERVAKLRSAIPRIH
jgi:hypothetical protein